MKHKLAGIVLRSTLFFGMVLGLFAYSVSTVQAGACWCGFPSGMNCAKVGMASKPSDCDGIPYSSKCTFSSDDNCVVAKQQVAEQAAKDAILNAPLAQTGQPASCLCATAATMPDGKTGYAKDCFKTQKDSDKPVLSQADCDARSIYLQKCYYSPDTTCAGAEKKLQDLIASTAQPTLTTEQEEAVRKIEIRKPIINILIPDLTFSDVRTTTIDQEGVLQIPWIGEYIAAVYRLAVTVASILSVILLIREGALIILSGGGEEKVQGYRNIARILTGLVLAWSSYVILYNINASLVSFKPLQIRFVDAELFNQDSHDCDDPSECDKPDPANPSKPVPKPVSMPLGKCASDIKLAQKDRKAKINYSLFGQVDGRTYRSRTLKDVTMVVIHNGGYTAEGNNQTWQSRAAAAHYTIDRNGTIYQHVGEECVVPHAPGRTGLGVVNNVGIGIELNIGKSGGKSCNSLGSSPSNADAVLEACTPTAAQYAALRSLIDDIISRTSVVLDASHIGGHCEYVKPDGHGDPRAFDWTQIGLDNQDKKDRAKGHACSWYLPFKNTATPTDTTAQ